MTSPIWTCCPHCGETRDSSNRYTSPANAERDYRSWQEEHLSGKCSEVIFASKTPRDLNHDETPWLRTHPGLGFMGRFKDRFPNDDANGYRMEYFPRGQFNHVQHREANPLMEDVRACLKDRRGTDFLQECLSLLEAMDDVVHARVAHVTHIRRALTRLAALATTGAPTALAAA